MQRNSDTEKPSIAPAETLAAHSPLVNFHPVYLIVQLCPSQVLVAHRLQSWAFKRGMKKRFEYQPGLFGSPQLPLAVPPRMTNWEPKETQPRLADTEKAEAGRGLGKPKVSTLSSTSRMGRDNTGGGRLQKSRSHPDLISLGKLWGAVPYFLDHLVRHDIRPKRRETLG